MAQVCLGITLLITAWIFTSMIAHTTKHKAARAFSSPATLASALSVASLVTDQIVITTTASASGAGVALCESAAGASHVLRAAAVSLLFVVLWLEVSRLYKQPKLLEFNNAVTCALLRAVPTLLALQFVADVVYATSRARALRCQRQTRLNAWCALQVFLSATAYATLLTLHFYPRLSKSCRRNARVLDRGTVALTGCCLLVCVAGSITRSLALPSFLVNFVGEVSTTACTLLVLVACVEGWRETAFATSWWRRGCEKPEAEEVVATRDVLPSYLSVLDRVRLKYSVERV